MTYFDIFLLVIGIVLIFIFIIFLRKAIKGIKEEEKDELLRQDNKPLSALEVAAKQSMDIAAQRGSTFVMSFYLSAISLAMAKLWEWWYKPLKVLITFLILIISSGTVIYFAVFTTNDEVVVTVLSPSNQGKIKLMKGIEVLIEARDNSTVNKDLVDAVEFSTLDESLQPNTKSITVTTNEDGIAYAKLKTRFDRKNLIFTVKVVTEGKKYSDIYQTQIDTFKFKGEENKFTVNLKSKRAKIYDYFEFIASLPNSRDKSFQPKPGEILPKNFNLEISLKNFEGYPTQDAKFFLWKNSTDSIALDFKNNQFVKEEIELRDKPYKVTFLAEDSSQLSYNIVMKDPNFKFEKPEKPIVLAAGGGAKSTPKKPKFERAETVEAANVNLYASFEFVKPKTDADIIEPIVKKLKSSKVTITYVGKETKEFTAKFDDAFSLILNQEPIQNLDVFWGQFDKITLFVKSGDFDNKNNLKLELNKASFTMTDTKKLVCSVTIAQSQSGDYVEFKQADKKGKKK